MKIQAIKQLLSEGKSETEIVKAMYQAFNVSESHTRRMIMFIEKGWAADRSSSIPVQSPASLRVPGIYFGLLYIDTASQSLMRCPVNSVDPFGNASNMILTGDISERCFSAQSDFRNYKVSNKNENNRC